MPERWTYASFTETGERLTAASFWLVDDKNMIRVIVHLLADHLDESWCVRVTSGQEAEGNCRHLAVAPSFVQTYKQVCAAL